MLRIPLILFALVARALLGNAMPVDNGRWLAYDDNANNYYEEPAEKRLVYIYDPAEKRFETQSEKRLVYVYDDSFEKHLEAQSGGRLAYIYDVYDDPVEKRSEKRPFYDVPVDIRSENRFSYNYDDAVEEQEYGYKRAECLVRF